VYWEKIDPFRFSRQLSTSKSIKYRQINNSDLRKLIYVIIAVSVCLYCCAYIYVWYYYDRKSNATVFCPSNEIWNEEIVKCAGK
jgi:hypothetical protein